METPIASTNHPNPVFSLSPVIFFDKKLPIKTKK